jgi:GNAT superfamily N-acetyltransferase
MIEISEATINDLAELSTLFDLYRQFYNQSANIAEAKRFLNERLIKKESIIYVSKDSDGHLTGFTQLYPVFSSVQMKRSWILNDLYVKNEFRKKGIARLLIQRCKKLAVETNADGLLLETSINNMEGNKLYPSEGFVLQDHENFYFWKKK